MSHSPVIGRNAGQVRRHTARHTTVAGIGLAIVILAPGSAAAQTVNDALASAWGSVCQSATGMSSLSGRCAEIFDPAPGASTRQSTAASGNNLATNTAFARSTTSVLGAYGDVRDRRREEIFYGEDGSAGAVGTDTMFGNLSIFVSGDLGYSERDQTAFENGWDADTYGVSGGGDYRFSNHLLAGVVVGYETMEADFTGNAGELDTDTVSVTGFLTVTPSASSYIDTYIGYADIDYENTRRISYVLNTGVPVAGLANSETNGDQFTVGWSAGYQMSAGALSYGPHISFDYSDTDIDGYAETDTLGFALAYGDQSIKSVQFSLGGRASHAISTSWGVLVPQVSFDYTHEFEDDSRTITSRFISDAAGTIIPIQTEAPDRNFFTAGIGVAAILPNGIAPYANYSALVGHEFLNDQRLTLGLRLEL